MAALIHKAPNNDPYTLVLNHEMSSSDGKLFRCRESRRIQIQLYDDGRHIVSYVRDNGEPLKPQSAKISFDRINKIALIYLGSQTEDLHISIPKDPKKSAITVSTNEKVIAKATDGSMCLIM